MKKLIKTTLLFSVPLTMLPCAINMSSCGNNSNQPHPAKLDKITKLDVTGSANLKIEGTFNENDLNSKPDLWFSKNAGKSWEQIQFTKSQTEQNIALEDKDIIYLAGNNPLGLNSKTSRIHFTISSIDESQPASVTLGGSIMSLLGDYAGQKTDIPCDWCFDNLFSYSNAITSISSSFLPATNLTSQCYNGLFAGCKSLLSIPENLLPAKDLSNVEACYGSMFDSCESIETLPAKLLQSTKLGTLCYYGMFNGCSNLKSIPTNFLPATTLAPKCYKAMFQHCKSLETLPTNLLPSTSIKDSIWCYDSMFACCYNLRSIITLPATELSEACYINMFLDCKTLNTLPDNLFPQNIKLAKECFVGMFAGCESLSTVSEDLLVFNGSTQQLADFCYQSMFADSGLTTTLKLPSTQLACGCYQELFKGTKIQHVPALPSTNVSDYAYRGMFKECKQLSEEDENAFTNLLHSTSLGIGCYESMFESAYLPTAVSTSMSTKFLLPATNSNVWCYKNMFKGSNIKSLPIINLTDVQEQTLAGMFANCFNLKIINSDWKIPAPKSSDSEGCYMEMFKNCYQLTTIPTDMIKTDPNVTLTPVSCFESMFENCHKLTNICTVPYTKFGVYSCASMFYKCNSLVDCSSLSISNVSAGSFQNAFKDCVSLTTCPQIADNIILSGYCFESMFEGCHSLSITSDSSSTGTKFFVCPEDIASGAVDDMFSDTLNSPETKWDAKSGSTYKYE